MWYLCLAIVFYLSVAIVIWKFARSLTLGMISGLIICEFMLDLLGI